MDDKILKIYKYGDDILKLKSTEIKNIDQATVQLIHYMTATLHKTHNGVGLAAPQVGHSLQLSVIDLTLGEQTDELMVLINPQILEANGSEIGDEGCLSLPGMTLGVNRKTGLLLKYIDIDGNEQRREFDGFKARVIQHEVDHLNGVMIIDRVSSLKRQLIKKEIKRMQKNGEW